MTEHTTIAERETASRIVVMKAYEGKKFVGGEEIADYHAAFILHFCGILALRSCVISYLDARPVRHVGLCQIPQGAIDVENCLKSQCS
jgi:hypothetical protein